MTLTTATSNYGTWAVLATLDGGETHEVTLDVQAGVEDTDAGPRLTQRGLALVREHLDAHGVEDELVQVICDEEVLWERPVILLLASLETWGTNCDEEDYERLEALASELAPSRCAIRRAHRGEIPGTYFVRGGTPTTIYGDEDRQVADAVVDSWIENVFAEDDRRRGVRARC